MNLKVITPQGGFAVLGDSLASIVEFIKAPPWVVDSVQAWYANEPEKPITVHFAPGYAVVVDAQGMQPSSPTVENDDSDEIDRKASLFSDYHKDFFGVRPDVSGMSREDRAKAYDAITDEIKQFKRTAEGRAFLRSRGWIVDSPAGET